MYRAAAIVLDPFAGAGSTLYGGFSNALLQERADADLEGLGQAFNDQDRWVADTALNTRHVGAVEA